MATQNLTEIFETIDRMKNKDDRIEFLKRHDSYPVKTVIQGALDTRVHWDLPQGPVAYTPNPLVDQEGAIVKECRKWAMYSVQSNLPQARKLMQFTEMLERLDARDAVMVVMIKDKKFYKNITKDVVDAAFPGLLG